MILDQIFLFFIFLFLGYSTEVLEAFGFEVTGFAESEEVPLYLGWIISIWIIIAMLVSIKMMVQRCVRLIF